MREKNEKKKRRRRKSKVQIYHWEEGEGCSEEEVERISPAFGEQKKKQDKMERKQKDKQNKEQEELPNFLNQPSALQEILPFFELMEGTLSRTPKD